MVCIGISSVVCIGMLGLGVLSADGVTGDDLGLGGLSGVGFARGSEALIMGWVGQPARALPEVQMPCCGSDVVIA